PTPAVPGRYALDLDLLTLHVEGLVDVRDRATTADAPIDDASIALAPGYEPPHPVRANSLFRVSVEIEGRSGPLLLASSRRRLPDRQGETLVVYEYRAREADAPAPVSLARPGLSVDLAPGEAVEQDWYLRTPGEPGSYDLLVRLAARGIPTASMPWRLLIPGLRV